VDAVEERFEPRDTDIVRRRLPAPDGGIDKRKGSKSTEAAAPELPEPFVCRLPTMPAFPWSRPSARRGWPIFRRR
jgi:hypothetical protein